MWGSPLLYERLSWPEVRRAAGEERVCLIPVATLEDHGPHLPIDTDLRITAEVCRRTAEAASDEIAPAHPPRLLAAPHGLPGPDHDRVGHIHALPDVGSSLARHGFRRMLFVNGHGSNQNFVEAAARLVNVEHPSVLAAAAFYLSGKQSLARVDELRDSVRGGMGHACELETSIYLAIDPDAVDMDKAVDERSYPDGEYAFMDWADGPLKLMPWWSSFSRTGVQGDATKATAEKGTALLEAAVEECVGFVRELLSWQIPERLEPRETP